MRTLALVAGMVVGALVLAAPARAQRTVVVNGRPAQSARPTVLELTPYAGYMIGGHYLDGPLGTSLGSANGALYGGQLAIRLAPHVALVGNLGYARTDLQVGLPIVGGYSIGSNQMLVYDGGVQLDLPLNTGSGLALAPFVQGGVGAIHNTVSASVLSTRATNLAWNVGGGIDVPLAPTMALRLMARDYMGRFDFSQATGVDYQGALSHNVALMGGLKLSF